MNFFSRYSKYLAGIFVGVLSVCFAGSAIAGIYNADTGVIDVACMDVVAHGKSLKKFHHVQLRYEGSVLTVLSLSKTGKTGFCDATFDLLNLEYRDVINIDGEVVEITAVLGSGVTLDIKDRVTQTNLILEDVTVAIMERAEVGLPQAIDTQALEIGLENGSPSPGFIGILDDTLVIEPGTGDAGQYDLRLRWGDRVELLEVTVMESPVAGFITSMQPESLPAYADLNLFSNSSPLNTPITQAPDIDSDSDILVASLRGTMQMVVQVGQYSAPVFFADSDTPRAAVDLACGESWETGVTALTGIPIPDWAVPADDSDGGEAPTGCGEDSGRDDFMVIVDLENRCEYDFWQARQVGDDWVASYGVAMSLDGTGISPTGMSARGSGFAFLGGVIWPDELASGRIDHVLAFSYDFTKAGGPVAPATDSDGITVSTTAIPEGALVQLDPALDLDSLDLEPYERTIARAMQVYGMLLVDTGGAGGPVGLYAIDPDSVTGDMYADIWGNEDFIVLENLELATLPLRVLTLGGQDGDWQDSLAPLTTSICSAYQLAF